MKILVRLLFAVLAVAAIAGLGYLVRMTQSVDADLHGDRLAQLRTINNLDVALNRAFTQTRAASLVDAAADRSQITQQLGDVLNGIDKGEKPLRGLSPELDKALDTFLDTIDAKFELGFDYEARSTLVNQRLVAGVDAIPGQAAETIGLAAGAPKEQIALLIDQLKSDVVNFGVTPTPTNAPNIRDQLRQLAELGQTQSEAFRESLDRLNARCEEVIADKLEQVDKLKAFLDRPTGPQLQDVERAYMAWYDTQVAAADQYRVYLAAYAGGLLLVLALLGLRLILSFRELDRANNHLEEQVETRTKDLSGALKELRASQAQLVQSEKMASLGQMVAGVAHEINTPLGYARGNAEIVRTALADIRDLCVAQDKALGLMTSSSASDEQVAAALGEAQEHRQRINAVELMDDLENLLKDTDYGLVQIADLVSSLKDFSRVDRSRTDLFDLNGGLDSALKICHNQLKHKVEVVRQYGELPQIECSPSQLNQVFLNLFTNAAQAIEHTGKIFIVTQPENDGVTVRILDTGCGMPEDVRKRIFEPFFTTKPVGKGTGLGLSIVYRIIEEHGGTIDVRSAPGKGSEFVIRLPLKQKRRTEAADAVPAPQPVLAAA